MIKLFKNSSHNYKDLLMASFKKIPWVLGKNAFLFILIFILADILIGGFLFYKYVFLIDREIATDSISNKFQERTYQSVLEEWEKREDALKRLLSPDKNYTDPFK